MEELIDRINELAIELLKAAVDLDKLLGDGNKNLEEFKERLEQICNLLTKIIEYLEQEPSPLRRLVRDVDGTLVAQVIERLENYIEDHRATLIRLRVPNQLIDHIVTALRSDAENGENAIDVPQTLRLEDAITPLKSLRDLVCEIAKATYLVQIIATPNILKMVVNATLGAATIVVDITGAVTASPYDPVGWVLLKAVKSVWAGATMVQHAVKEINGMLEIIREKIDNDAEEQSSREMLRKLKEKRAALGDKVNLHPKKNDPDAGE